MTQTKEHDLDLIIEKAIHLARSNNRFQVVSFTKKIDSIHPVYFFNRAKGLNKDRMFWMNASRDFYLVGVGQAKELIEEDDVYENMDKSWQHLIEEAIVHNPYDVPGTGLVGIGGMTFDPLEKRTSLWDKFPRALLTIPQIMLTAYREEGYLTFNTIINPKDSLGDYLQRFSEWEEQLLKEGHVSSSKEPLKILSKDEGDIEKWFASIEKAKAAIRSDEAKKIVLARKLQLVLNRQPNKTAFIEKLIKTQLDSYIFVFERKGDCFISATPERLVHIEGDQLLSTCLAGTSPRGKTKEEDENLRNQLLQDEKNLLEHQYVVQMIKDSITPFSEHIDLPDSPIVHSLKNVHHLYTPVKAQLKKDGTIFNIVEQLHPTPALGGVPRKDSLAFIRKEEAFERGWYGSPVGWIDHQKNGEFAVAIRSALIQEEQASLFAGCGIMEDSDVAKEYEETNVKFLPMLNVLEEQQS